MAVRFVGHAADIGELELEALIKSASSIRTASATTSLPTPSPGNTAMFIAATSSSLTSQGCSRQAFVLERRDLVFVAQCQFDVVESIEQAMLTKRRDLERMLRAVGLDDTLARQVNGQPIADVRGDLVEQAIDDALAAAPPAPIHSSCNC